MNPAKLLTGSGQWTLETDAQGDLRPSADRQTVNRSIRKVEGNGREGCSVKTLNDLNPHPLSLTHTVTTRIM